MKPLTKEEFYQRFGNRLRSLREEQGLSREEMSEQISEKMQNRTAEDEERIVRYIIAVATSVEWYREKKGWSKEQLAEKCDVPVSAIEDVESLRDVNPDGYLLYRAAHAFGLELGKFMQNAWDLAAHSAPESDGQEGRSE